MSARTFKLTSPHLHGDDVTGWQQNLNTQLRRWHANDLLNVDGDYGAATRSFTSKVLYGLGITQDQMADGVTPALRIKIRNRKLTVAERVRYANRLAWRKKLAGGHVSSPLVKILADSWGWHPGVHDGIDLICPPNSPIHSMTDGVVVRADTSGWWGQGNPGGATGAKGDGITIVRCAENVGPFRKGMHVCYGHAEHPVVKVGATVHAGQHIATAGFAVAWHIHAMVNMNAADASGFVRGVGDRDPRLYYEYAVKNG